MVAPITITRDEVTPLDAALPGGLSAFHARYAAAVVSADPARPIEEAGAVQQDHGIVEFGPDVPNGSMATVAEALAQVRADAPMRAAQALAVYAEDKHDRVLNGGIRVDVGDGIHADVATTDKGRGLVTGCIGLADLAAKLGQPEPTFPWVNNDGSPLSLTVAQMQQIAFALGVFTQATYAALGRVGPGIAAGTIRSVADIDALPWPATIG